MQENQTQSEANESSVPETALSPAPQGKHGLTHMHPKVAAALDTATEVYTRIPKNVAEWREKLEGMHDTEAAVRAALARAVRPLTVVRPPEATPAAPIRPPKKHFVPASTGRKRRDDALAPLIRKAQAACDDKWNAHEVYSQLQPMATSKTNRPHPLLGEDEGGIKWESNGKVRWLTAKNLGQRLQRERDGQAD